MIEAIKQGFEVVGQLKEINDYLIYQTTRNSEKKQIYLYKTVFEEVDTKRIYFGINCIGISKSVCRRLLARKEEEEKPVMIYFTIENYPKHSDISIRRITLANFLMKGTKIKENGYDEQYIIAMKELEVM